MGNSIATLQEIRIPISENPTIRAQARDAEVLFLVDQVSKALRSWSRIGQLIALVDQDSDWRPLGYKSHAQWLKSLETRANLSLSTLYHFWDKFKEIENHPHAADLVQITEGTMEVFRQLP